MTTQIKGTGTWGDKVAQVDPSNNALRTSLRPVEKGVFGAYQLALTSGLMAAGLAAGSPIFAFRWSSASANALIRRVRFLAGTDATAFAQGSVIIDMIRATNFSVQDTGGASISLIGKSQAKSTRFAASQQQIAGTATGNVAIASTATLTAGTRTLDNNAMSVIVSSVGAVPANFVSATPGNLWDPAEAGREPLELQNGEGFVIRATVPATGTWKFGVEVEWDEVDPARYFN